jgi:FkbM family methyltransferase
VDKQSYTVSYVEKEVDGAKYYLPTYASHRPAVRAVETGQMYEPETHFLIRKIQTKKPGNMIHAGTFYGDMLPSFSRSCPRTVFAFEPVLENYVLAKLCVENNGLENVLLFNSALGQKVGMARINTGIGESQHRGGASMISTKGQLTPVVTIDGLSVDDLSIIQLDVEGYELEALLGAVVSIRKYRPIIMVEDNNGNCANFLNLFGYELSRTIPGLMVWTHESQIADKALVA